MLPVLTVVLLHGLGERTWTLGAFEWYMQLTGIITVHKPYWPANSCLMPDECLPLLSAEMKRTLDPSNPIVVVGNSMGGVAAYYLPAYGWNVDKAFYVGAPLHGSKLLRDSLEWFSNSSLERAGNWLAHQAVGKGPFEYLASYHDLYPPRHSYWTISPILPFSRDFDGHVYSSDSILEKSHSLVVPYASHFSLLYECRIWNMILGRILLGETYVDGSVDRMESFCTYLSFGGGAMILSAQAVIIVLLFKVLRAVWRQTF